MTKTELETIASALQHSRDDLEKEAKLFDAKNERPKSVKYWKEELIPEINKAYQIVIKEYEQKRI